MMQANLSGTFPVGSQVRVVQSVVVYHHPDHRGEAFDMKGQEGQVVALVQEWNGKPVSANLPVQVKFTNKFKAHFHASELEPIA